MFLSKFQLTLTPGIIAALIIAGVLFLVFLVTILIMVPFKLWFRALVSSAHISMVKLIGMKFRKTDSQLIVLNYITARKAGLKISVDELETHYLAGGNVERVVKALIASNSANIDLTVQKAKAIDLAGRDIYSAVKFLPLLRTVSNLSLELKLLLFLTCLCKSPVLVKKLLSPE